MTFGMPQTLTMQNLVSARGDAARLIAYINIVATAGFLLAIQGLWHTGTHWLSWAALLGLLVVVFVNFRLGSSPWVLLTLVLGTALVAVFLFDAPRLMERQWIDQVVLALPKIAVLTLAGGIRRSRDGFLATVSVYLGMLAVDLLASVIAGYHYSFDVLTTGALVVILGVGFFGLAVQRYILPARARIRQAQDDEALTTHREDAESRAVARIHDTFLNEISVIAQAYGPDIPAPLLEEMRESLEQFESHEWLAETIGPPQEQAYQRWMGSGVFHAISEMRSRGLIVKLSGDTLLIGRLGPEQDRALGLAVRQCLLNVQRHANTSEVEVSFSRMDTRVAVVVADEGVGFDPERVAGDRLGLRHSVFRRVGLAGGQVRLFSTPGVGTSVVLMVPIDPSGGEAAQPAGTPTPAPSSKERLARWFSQIFGLRSGKSLQQLDPLGSVVYWPIVVLAATLMLLLPIGITMWRFGTGLARGGLDELAAICGGIVFVLIGVILLALLTMPKYSPLTPLRTVLLNAVFLAATAIAYWHYFDTRLVVGISWGSLILSLLLLAITAYRPPARLLAHTLVLAVAVFGYIMFLAHTHLAPDYPVLLAMLGTYPILAVGLGSWRFSATAVTQAREWQRISLERELRVANRRNLDAVRSIQKLWQKRLSTEVLPFLHEIIEYSDAGREITPAHRQRAARLGEALRGIMASDNELRWYGGKVDETVAKELAVLNELLAVPTNNHEGGGMSPGQRCALRAYLQFLLDHDHGHPETLRIRITRDSEAAPRRVDLRLRMMVDASYAEFAARASVVFFLMRLEFNDVVGNFTRPVLDMKFSYDKE